MNVNTRTNCRHPWKSIRVKVATHGTGSMHVASVNCIECDVTLAIGNGVVALIWDKLHQRIDELAGSIVLAENAQARLDRMEATIEAMRTGSFIRTSSGPGLRPYQDDEIDPAKIEYHRDQFIRVVREIAPGITDDEAKSIADEWVDEGGAIDVIKSGLMFARYGQAISMIRDRMIRDVLTAKTVKAGDEIPGLGTVVESKRGSSPGPAIGGSPISWDVRTNATSNVRTVSHVIGNPRYRFEFEIEFGRALTKIEQDQFRQVMLHHAIVLHGCLDSRKSLSELIQAHGFDPAGEMRKAFGLAFESEGRPMSEARDAMIAVAKQCGATDEVANAFADDELANDPAGVVFGEDFHRRLMTKIAMTRGSQKTL